MTNLLAQALSLILLAESSGGKNTKPGDEGKAIGPFQMHKIFVDDVNRIARIEKIPASFTYEDREDRAKSEQMAKIYLRYYCTFERLGHQPTIEDYCRTFNGGPTGPWKVATLVYWDNIVERFNALALNDPIRQNVRI